MLVKRKLYCFFHTYNRQIKITNSIQPNKKNLNINTCTTCQLQLEPKHFVATSLRIHARQHSSFNSITQFTHFAALEKCFNIFNSKQTAMAMVL